MQEPTNSQEKVDRFIGQAMLKTFTLSSKFCVFSFNLANNAFKAAIPPILKNYTKIQTFRVLNNIANGIDVLKSKCQNDYENIKNISVNSIDVNEIKESALKCEELSFGDLIESNHNGNNSFHLAAFNNDLFFIAKNLINYLSNQTEAIEILEKCNKRGDSFLHVAARNGNVQVLQMVAEILNHANEFRIDNQFASKYLEKIQSGHQFDDNEISSSQYANDYKYLLHFPNKHGDEIIKFFPGNYFPEELMGGVEVTKK